MLIRLDHKRYPETFLVASTIDRVAAADRGPNRAERRLGEMMAHQPKAKPLGDNQHRKVDRLAAPLSEPGIFNGP